MELMKKTITPELCKSCNTMKNNLIDGVCKRCQQPEKIQTNEFVYIDGKIATKSYLKEQKDHICDATKKADSQLLSFNEYIEEQLTNNPALRKKVKVAEKALEQPEQEAKSTQTYPNLLKTTQGDWKVEFTKRFVIEKNNVGIPYVTNPVEVKQFIAQELAKQRQGFRELVQSKRRVCSYQENGEADYCEDLPYNMALGDILEALK